MVIFIIFNIFTTPIPSFFTLFVLLLGVDTWHHSIIKKGVCFSHVYNIYFDIYIFWRTIDPKVKPLSITFGVDIILQD